MTATSRAGPAHTFLQRCFGILGKGYRVYPTAGKIQLQSEGAEIYYRGVEMIPVENAKPASRYQPAAR